MTMNNNDQKYLKAIDFHFVEDKHAQIHVRLENWARWAVEGRGPSWISPMFRMARSNARHWHVPELRVAVNVLDAQAVEKAVFALPEANRFAIRWCYVIQNRPTWPRKALGVTEVGLWQLIRDGRTMLVNRRA